jgi:hypothetical protein
MQEPQQLRESQDKSFRERIIESWGLMMVAYREIIKNVQERRTDPELKAFYKGQIISMYKFFFKYKDKDGALKKLLEPYTKNPTRLKLSMCDSIIDEMGKIMDNQGILEVSEQRPKT